VSFTENLELAIAANKYLMKDLQKICIDRACSSLVPIRVFAAEIVAELLDEEKLAELCCKVAIHIS